MGEIRSPSRYVLDGLDDEAVDAALVEARAIGKKVSFDLTNADWDAVRSLTETEPQPAGPPPALTRSLVVAGAGDQLPVLYRPQLWGTFDSVSSEEVSRRKSKKVTSAWRTLQATLKQAKARSVAEFLAAFLPQPDVLRQASDGFLARLYESIAKALKQLVNGAIRAGAVVLNVLKDPDSYYLRLRGQIMEALLRGNAGNLASFLLFLPDLFRLYIRLLLDRRVSLQVKGEVLFCLAYLIAPADLIPEVIVGPAGYVEDTYFMVRTLGKLTSSNSVAEGLLEEHWSGDSASLSGLIRFSDWICENLPWLDSLWREFQKSRGEPEPESA